MFLRTRYHGYRTRTCILIILVGAAIFILFVPKKSNSRMRDDLNRLDDFENSVAVSNITSSTVSSVTSNVCTIGSDHKVHSTSHNYSECVSKWLFTIDTRTRSRKYPDQNDITRNVQTGKLPKYYQAPRQANISTEAKCFHISEEKLEILGQPFRDHHVVDDHNVQDFVFVTGVSDSHYVESLDAIASVQKFMPGYQIIMYDLGLTKEQLSKMKTYCGVTIKEFNCFKSALYPKHVKNLSTFAFKPLIILEALRTHPAIVWLDSSARLHQSLEVFYPSIVKSGGVYLFVPPPKRSVVHHVHPSIYEFFPSNLLQLRHTMILMPDGYFSRSEQLFWNVLWWWGLCALTEECIYPTRIQPCSPFTADNVLGYIDCHRYDMAVLNLLLANYHGYDYSVYGGKRDNSVFEKLRKHTKFYDIRVCVDE